MLQVDGHPPRPEALLLDFGGTILRPIQFNRRRGIAAVLEYATPPSGHLLDAAVALSEQLTRTIDAQLEGSTLEYSQRAFQRLLYESLGVRFDVPQELLEIVYWNEAITMEPEPGIAAALEIASDAGLPMAVLSNSAFHAPVLEQALSAVGLRDYFRFVLATADYGLRKPGPEIFAVALKRLQVEARACWYIGNAQEFDVAGARAAGCYPVWYDEVGEGSSVPAASARIESWSELPALLARAGVQISL